MDPQSSVLGVRTRYGCHRRFGWRARRSEPRDRLLRAEHRLLPADPDHALARRLQPRLALRIVLAGERMVVPLAAISLDHQSLLGAAESGLVRLPPATISLPTSGLAKPPSAIRSWTAS